MGRFLMLLICMNFLSVLAFSQDGYRLYGLVTDEYNQPLTGAAVFLNAFDKGTFTDSEGKYIISGIAKGKYRISIRYTGYNTFSDSVSIKGDTSFDAMLGIELLNLQEVVIEGDYAEERKKESPLNIEIVNDVFLKQNLGGSLMKSFERLPGVASMDIGSGQSKPAIRGLGFNRIAVFENGIKHEGQQWGEEHGLEIDQYAIDRIEVLKGPASLIYGPDAIGGVIDLKQVEIPLERTIGGAVDLTARSNNSFLGTSAGFYARKKDWFITTRVTLADYADYRVPADSVAIYSYLVPLYKNRLRNTAGDEHNFHLSFGRSGNLSANRIFISNLRSRSGFFANAHGIEPRKVDTGLHDSSDRDILYPYQQVNHFKIISKNEFRSDKLKLEADLGYQRNDREEWSNYVAHGYMPSVFPGNSDFAGDLELEFSKEIYSANIRSHFEFSDRITLTNGVSAEYQDNRIGGRGFIIPEFKQFNSGAFAYGKFTISESSIIHAGLRYDFGNLVTSEYNDWFLSPVFSQAGDTSGFEYLQRAPGLSRTFNSICWSVGYNYNIPSLSLKINAGKSFRMPIAKELAANGVNYHHFSYESGNPDLSAEVSYQLDMGLEWNLPRLAIGLSPFFNYFPNYIYQNPSYRHDYLYGAGNQVFYYTQSEVMRFGGEMHLHYKLLESLQAGLVGEYVYSEQMSGLKRGFSLPFSPPANIMLNLKYSAGTFKFLRDAYISADYILVAEQNRIVPPEDKTPGYCKVNLSAGTSVYVNGKPVIINLQLQNLLNRKYYNHTSYYRRINLPEAGRNFMLNITIPFEYQTDKKQMSNN